MSDPMYQNLLETIDSSSFNCFQCIYELSKYGNNIGVQHHLVEKLSTYPYSELEFFIPQLVQIVVSFETESMALRDLIFNLSREFPHFCLLTFWNLQAYIFELRAQPDSYSFHVVRTFVNSLQDIMFNHSSATKSQTVLRENLHPSLILSAVVGASFGLPNIHDYVKPIILSQGKQQKSFLFKLANFHKSLTKNLTLKNSGRTIDLGSSGHESGDEEASTPNLNHQRYSESVLANRRLSRSSSTFALDSDCEDVHYNSDHAEDYRREHTIKSRNILPKRSALHSVSSTFSKADDSFASSSMPNLSEIDNMSVRGAVVSAPTTPRVFDESILKTKLSNLGLHDDKNHIENGTWILKANYFRKETEFMMVLQNISSTLSQVPKEARLTSLRAELSIVNNALFPSQVDIPQLFPSISSPNKKYHRILKLNVSEACVLNSAERVPYLLLIEFLSEDMDFDPSSDTNRTLLTSKTNMPRLSRTDSAKANTDHHVEVPSSTVDEETDLGDYSVVSLYNKKRNLREHTDEVTKTENISSSGPKRGLDLQHRFPTSKPDVPPPIPSGGKTKDLSSQIRIAAVMLKQLEKSGQANSEQSSAIKSRIIKAMEALQDKFETIDYQQIQEISAVHDGDVDQDAGERKIENDLKIGEDWATKRARIRKTSMYGHLPHWDLCSVIVKNGDDLQQEAFACQLISVISHAWKEDNIGVWTKNMKIVIISFNSGLVETINNALSVHSIKKTMTELSMRSGENPKGTVASIKDYFLKIHGPENSASFKKAQDNFSRSLAAYSIICYVLQIKDRHNGNIMLDNEGHIMHIDFGFILSNSPGSVGFEAAPFKLTMEYVEVLGGLDSSFYKQFTQLAKKCFLSLRKHCDQLINLVDLMQKDSSLPCFKNGPQTSILLRQRLQLDLTDTEAEEFVETNLIGKSVGSVYARLYDQFQLLTQGIYN